MIKGNTTLKELKLIEPVEPFGVGKYWQGISHHKLLNTISTLAQDRKWNTQYWTIGVSRDKQDLAASLILEIPGLYPKTLCLGVVNSNARRYSLQFYGGVYFLADKVGIVLSRDDTSHKHTLGVKLEGEIEAALNVFHQSASSFEAKILELEKTWITTNQAAVALSEAGIGEMIAWSRIGKITGMFHKNNRQTAWSLLSQFAKVAQRSPVMSQMKSVYEFLQVVENISVLVA